VAAVFRRVAAAAVSRRVSGAAIGVAAIGHGVAVAAIVVASASIGVAVAAIRWLPAAAVLVTGSHRGPAFLLHGRAHRRSAPPVARGVGGLALLGFRLAVAVAVPITVALGECAAGGECDG